jgi:hypothetical protein
VPHLPCRAIDVLEATAFHAAHLVQPRQVQRLGEAAGKLDESTASKSAGHKAVGVQVPLPGNVIIKELKQKCRP